jgi:hypothetical protein
MANLQTRHEARLARLPQRDPDAPDLKHDQDLRDTCVILLDRAGNDPLSICDVTDHSY